MQNNDKTITIYDIAKEAGVSASTVSRVLTNSANVRSEKKEKIMAWLLYAVTKAEAEFGSGTGQAKLHYVYNMFIDKFPVAAKCITFEAFSTMVDQALEEMRKMLQDNKKIATLVDEQKL